MKLRRYLLLVCFLGVAMSQPQSKPAALEIVLQTGHQAPIAAIAFSSDDKYLISYGDQQLKLWDLASRLLLNTDDEWPTFANGAVALSSDAQFLAGATGMDTPHGAT